MIGKSLNERYGVAMRPLAGAQATAILEEALASLAKPIVEVRAQDARMIAVVVVRADAAAERMCRALGFEVKPGGSGVFGLAGADAAKLFARLGDRERAWLEAPCGARETKVLLVAGGVALLSLETADGKVTVRALP